MESSKLPVRKWVLAIYLLSTSLKGVSSMKLHRDLGVTQKTAWMMAQKIREGWIKGTSGPVGGGVEFDEAFIGGRERNKHESKKTKAGRGTVGKEPVFAVKQRGGGVRAEHVGDVRRNTMRRFLDTNVEAGSTLYTDDTATARGIPDLFNRKMSPKHLQRYVTEFAGRHNVRDLDTLEQMRLIAQGMCGRSLPWQKLVA